MPLTCGPKRMDGAFFMGFKEAVRELYFWTMGGGTNFHALLYTLIQKADMDNRRRLANGFPEEVRAFLIWQNSPDEMEFFRMYDLQPAKRKMRSRDESNARNN